MRYMPVLEEGEAVPPHPHCQSLLRCFEPDDNHNFLIIITDLYGQSQSRCFSLGKASPAGVESSARFPLLEGVAVVPGQGLLKPNVFKCFRCHVFT